LTLVDEVLADSPAGFWMMHNLVDLSGNSNTLSVVGSAPSVGASIIPSVSTGSREFANNNNRLSAADHVTLDLGDVWTLEAWVRLPGTTGATQSIINKGIGAYQLGINSSLGFGIARYAVSNIVDATVALTVGPTYHLVGTKNGAAAKVYLDGVDVTGSVTVTTAVDTTTNLFTGGDPFSGEDGFYSLQAAAVYPTALSQARVQAHFNAGELVALPSDTPFPLSGRGASW
jgi:hypothetical protein